VKGMTQLGDIEHVERELEAFRARTQDTLKSFDRLTELISEFAQTKQAYEAEVENAAQITDMLKDNFNDIDQNWLQLKSEVDEALKQLKGAEVEWDRRWNQYEEENKKAHEDIMASWQEFRTRLKQKIAEMQNSSEQRWTSLEEGLAKTKNGLIAANRNQQTQLEQMIIDLRGDSELHLAEVNRGFDVQDARLDDIQTTLEQRTTKLRENSIKMRNEFQAAQEDLRTTLWKMADDLRDEANGGSSKIEKSLTFQAVRVDEINESMEARLAEANRLAGELEASRQEYRGELSVFEQKNAVMELRIERLQRMFWAMLVLIIIVVIIIIYITYPSSIQMHLA
jgi:chromosome segregation ATPase